MCHIIISMYASFFSHSLRLYRKLYSYYLSLLPYSIYNFNSMNCMRSNCCSCYYKFYLISCCCCFFTFILWMMLTVCLFIKVNNKIVRENRMKGKWVSFNQTFPMNSNRKQQTIKFSDLTYHLMMMKTKIPCHIARTIWWYIQIIIMN